MPGPQEDRDSTGAEKSGDANPGENRCGFSVLPAPQHNFQGHDLSDDDHDERDRRLSSCPALRRSG